MTASAPFPVPVKDAPRSHPKFVAFLLRLVDGVTDNEGFPDPDPSGAELKDAADQLLAAIVRAKHGGPAATADRDAKRLAADLLVDRLVVHVQTSLRATPTSAADAAAKILAVGLAIQKRRTDTKPAFAAKHGLVSGDVILVARAVAAQALYFFEMSSDGTSWTEFDRSMQVTLTLHDLVPGQVYHFRFRAHTRRGLGEYSPVASIRVL